MVTQVIKDTYKCKEEKSENRFTFTDKYNNRECKVQQQTDQFNMSLWDPIAWHNVVVELKTFGTSYILLYYFKHNNICVKRQGIITIE